MKTFYIQLAEDNTITDVISYSVAGYIPVELDTPLQVGINSGAYQLINGSIVRKSMSLDEVLTILTDEQKEELKTML